MMRLIEGLLSLSARRLQMLIGLPFLILGGWALLSPATVLLLTVRAEFRSDADIVPLLIGSFGAQALLCALFIFSTRFGRWTFLAYALSLLPFFWFDWYFFFVHQIFSLGIGIDFVGNLVMLALCALGWRASRREGL
jgi:hypothetical protein